jgi:hypothetical protein
MNLFDHLSLYTGQFLNCLIDLLVNRFRFSKSTIMRKILFLLLAFPAIVNAQINRSATEFAKDNISEYITTKLFKGNPYNPVSYGELKSWKEKNSRITCFIQHEFEITEIRANAGKKIAVQKPYKFTFYFDEKMKVHRAESFYSN